MIDPQLWFEREFPFGADPKTFPSVVERLRGAPIRVEQKIAGLAPEVLTERPGGGWSLQTNLGHLLDLEPMWLGRVEDIRAGLEEMRPADLTNALTHETDHDSVAADELLARFRTARFGLVRQLDELDEAGAAAGARHPRLGQPMRTIDLATFVADHDDHHLARMHALTVRLGARG